MQGNMSSYTLFTTTNVSTTSSVVSDPSVGSLALAISVALTFFACFSMATASYVTRLRSASIYVLQDEIDEVRAATPPPMYSLHDANKLPAYSDC